MAKYIEKDALPQFNLYKPCESEDFYYNIDFINGNNNYYYDGDEGFTAEAMDFPVDADIFRTLYEKCFIGNLSKSKIKDAGDSQIIAGEEIQAAKELDTDNGIFMRDMLNIALKNIFYDERYKETWTKRLESVNKDKNPITGSIFQTISAYYNAASFIKMITVAQGYPYEIGKDRVLFPKLLLIEADLYKKCRDSKEYLDIDFDFLKSQCLNEIPVITINGDSPEKKTIFTITLNSPAALFIKKMIEESAANSDNGYISIKDIIEIDILTPSNGISRYFVYKNPYLYTKDGVDYIDERAVITTMPSLCHPKGDYNANRCNNTTCVYVPSTTSKTPIDTCAITKSVFRKVAAVAYCYTEYRKKSLNKKETPENKQTTAYEKDKKQPYVPYNMLKLYDVKMSDEEKARFNKFAMYSGKSSAYPSTEKCPHIRRGYMRYNPKTGLKDIAVTGCIIHKDRYQGFASADRLVK